MATIRFYIRKPDLVLMYVIFSRHSILRYSTGEHCLPENWSTTSQRAKNGVGYVKINERIDNLDTRTREIITTLQRQGENLSPETVRRHLLVFDGKAEPSHESLLKYAESFRKVLKGRGTDTWKSIQTLINHLKAYGRIYGEPDFGDMNMMFYNQFVEYFTREGYSVNFTGKMIRNLKWMLSTASDEGIAVNPAFRSKRFRGRSEEVYNIYLSVSELKKIHSHSYSQPHLRKTADLFLVAAFTGMRYGDARRLSARHVSNGHITQDMQKVSGRVIIPIHPIVKEIFTRYGENFPEPISNQKMNLYLKEVGKEAGITDPVIKSRTEGGIKKTQTYQKWELLTVHTARRSLASNLYLAGVPIMTIMRLTGHKTLTSFLKYVKIGEKEISDSLQNHPFFRDEDVKNPAIVRSTGFF